MFYNIYSQPSPKEIEINWKVEYLQIQFVKELMKRELINKPIG